MRAIVILYEGKELPLVIQKETIAAMAQFIENGSHPVLKQLTEDEVAKLIVSRALTGYGKIIEVDGKSKYTPEENAAIYLAGLFSEYLKTSYTPILSSAVIKYVLKDNDTKFATAIQILSKENALDNIKSSVYRDHCISRKQLDVIVKTCKFCKTIK